MANSNAACNTLVPTNDTTAPVKKTTTAAKATGMAKKATDSQQTLTQVLAKISRYQNIMSIKFQS
jgi:hypothetical protein